MTLECHTNGYSSHTSMWGNAAPRARMGVTYTPIPPNTSGGPAIDPERYPDQGTWETAGVGDRVAKGVNGA